MTRVVLRYMQRVWVLQQADYNALEVQPAYLS